MPASGERIAGNNRSGITRALHRHDPSRGVSSIFWVRSGRVGSVQVGSDRVESGRVGSGRDIASMKKQPERELGTGVPQAFIPENGTATPWQLSAVDERCFLLWILTIPPSGAEPPRTTNFWLFNRPKYILCR